MISKTFDEKKNNKQITLETYPSYHDYVHGIYHGPRQYQLRGLGNEP